jgi:hypothetical protein
LTPFAQTGYWHAPVFEHDVAAQPPAEGKQLPVQQTPPMQTLLAQSLLAVHEPPGPTPPFETHSLLLLQV